MSTVPASGVNSPSIRLSKVDFPVPLLPTIPILSVFWTRRLKSVKIGLSAENAKLTCSKLMTFLPILDVATLIERSSDELTLLTSFLISSNRSIRAFCLVARAWGDLRIQANSCLYNCLLLWCWADSLSSLSAFCCR